MPGIELILWCNFVARFLSHLRSSLCLGNRKLLSHIPCNVLFYSNGPLIRSPARKRWSCYGTHPSCPKPLKLEISKLENWREEFPFQEEAWANDGSSGASSRSEAGMETSASSSGDAVSTCSDNGCFIYHKVCYPGRNVFLPQPLIATAPSPLNNCRSISWTPLRDWP